MQERITTYHQDKDQIRSEQALVEEAKKDPARFGLLYKKYYEQIFLFVLKRVESEDTAAEICSQVFLKALTNISKYRDMGLPFSSWLFRIARNAMYDLYNQDKINMVVSFESKSVHNIIAGMNAEEKPDYSSLTAALGMLEDADMELMELRFFENRAFKEIGEILDITENNAKVRCYRVIDKLKLLLKNER